MNVGNHGCQARLRSRWWTLAIVLLMMPDAVLAYDSVSFSNTTDARVVVLIPLFGGIVVDPDSRARFVLPAPIGRDETITFRLWAPCSNQREVSTIRWSPRDGATILLSSYDHFGAYSLTDSRGCWDEMLPALDKLLEPKEVPQQPEPPPAVEPDACRVAFSSYSGQLSYVLEHTPPGDVRVVTVLTARSDADRQDFASNWAPGAKTVGGPYSEHETAVDVACGRCPQSHDPQCQRD